MEDGEVVELPEDENDLRHKLKRAHADDDEEDEDGGLAIKPPPVPTKKRKHRHKTKEEKKKKHRKKRSRSKEKSTTEEVKEKSRNEDRAARERHVDHHDEYRRKGDWRREEDNRHYDRNIEPPNRSVHSRIRREDNVNRDVRDRGQHHQLSRRKDPEDRSFATDKSYYRKEHPRHQTTGGVDFHPRPSSQVSRRPMESSGAQHRREEVRGPRGKPPPLLVRRYDNDEVDPSRGGRKHTEKRYPKHSSQPSEQSSRKDHGKFREGERRQRDDDYNLPDRSHHRSQTTTGVTSNIDSGALSAVSSNDEKAEDDIEPNEDDTEDPEKMVEGSPSHSGSEIEQSYSGSEATGDEGQNSSGSEEEQEESGDEEASSEDKSGSESEHGSPTNQVRSKFDSPEKDDEEDLEMASGDDSAQDEADEEDKEASDSEDPDGGSPEQSPEEEKPVLPFYLPALQGCRSVDEFQCLNRIEEGTYGVVYRAKDKKTGDVVALKRLKMEKEREGFPITSLREVCTLLKAHHNNIVRVQEIVVGSNMDKIYIVMDYVEHDLKSLMETMKQPFLVGEVKTLMIQLLQGVHHLHDNWILHRDLKTSNLLLSHSGILKIGDFGLAREYGSPLKPYTPIVVTLWYRSPELLLGCKEYSTYIDMWSVGCIFAELLTMKALFPGKSEMMQLNLIFKELGTPSEKIWPGYNELPLVKKANFSNYPYNNLRKRFGASITEKGFKFLNRFLTYCPSKRISASNALNHEWFKETPLLVDPSMFPTWPAKSEQPRVKKVVDSPKAPQGGKEYNNLLNEEEGLVAGFQLTAPKHGISKHGTGFNLKF